MKAPIAIRCGIVNCYLVGESRFALIDAGYPGMEDRIVDSIRDAGVDPKLVSLIVITHAHVDHYGSAAALRSRFRVPIACSREDAGDIETGVNRHLTPVGVSGSLAGFFARLAAAGRKPSSSALVPDILFARPSTLEQWGVDASIVPCAGHTPGSLAVVPGADAASAWEGVLTVPYPWAIVGDLAFGRFTAPRRARLPIFASDRAALTENLRRFSGTETVYVGHGGPLRGADLAQLS